MRKLTYSPATFMATRSVFKARIEAAGVPMKGWLALWKQSEEHKWLVGALSPSERKRRRL